MEKTLIEEIRYWRWYCPECMEDNILNINPENLRYVICSNCEEKFEPDYMD